jgi:UPF0271 protein
VDNTLYIFDTTALIKGVNLSVLEESICYTTNSVLEEVRNSFSKQKINTALITGNLKITDPSPESITQAKSVAQTSGDLPFLSSTDIDVIALAITLQSDPLDQSSQSHIAVVSDDYSIQNVLTLLAIPIHSFMKKGVQCYIQWQVYCPQCNCLYNKPKSKVCAKCGTKLKRRPVDKK